MPIKAESGVGLGEPRMVAAAVVGLGVGRAREASGGLVYLVYLVYLWLSVQE